MQVLIPVRRAQKLLSLATCGRFAVQDGRRRCKALLCRGKGTGFPGFLEEIILLTIDLLHRR